MTFTVVLTAEAQSDLKGLRNPAFQARILDKLEWMGENASLLRHQSLQGQEWQGCFKYRIGHYCIIYQLDLNNSILTVLKVGHRRDAYK